MLWGNKCDKGQEHSLICNDNRYFEAGDIKAAPIINERYNMACVWRISFDSTGGGGGGRLKKGNSYETSEGSIILITAKNKKSLVMCV